MVNRKQNKGSNRSRNQRQQPMMNPLGDRAALRGAAKPDFHISKRSIWAGRQSSFIMTESTASSQTYGPVGTPFLDTTIYTRLAEFYPPGSSTLRSYDQFRFKRLRCYAFNTLGRIQNVRIMSSVDMDNRGIEGWDVLRQRSNTAVTSLTLDNSMQLIGDFKPTLNFTVTSSSDPENIVFSRDEWVDCSAVNQEFIGLKVHAEGEVLTSPSENPEISVLICADIEFRGRI